MKVRELIRRLKQDGWHTIQSKSGHRQFKHPTKPGRVTVSGKLSDYNAAGDTPERFSTGRLGFLKRRWL